MRLKPESGMIPLWLIVFLVIALGLVGGIMYYLTGGRSQQEKEDQERLLVQQHQQQKNEPKQRPCYDESNFWFWDGGNKKAQIYFAADYSSVSGTLLDKEGKKSIYTFSLEPDGFMSLKIIGKGDILVYGDGALSCDSVELNIRGACTECSPPGYIPQDKKVDPSSFGVPAEVKITLE